MRRRGPGILLLFAATACQAQTVPVPSAARANNRLTAAEERSGWVLLFDGTTTQGWRGYLKPEMPDGWKVVDGALTRTGPGGDLVTRSTWKDFELVLDWKVSPGGNSGVFYRAVEGPEAIYQSAPEMQVLDDRLHPDGRSPLTSAGAVYGLYPAPRGAVRPAGEWNTARLLVRGNHVEHWLNGVKTADYELHSADWSSRVAASKFKEWPAYGQGAEGLIGLQDHGNWVAYRNIRIRALP